MQIVSPGHDQNADFRFRLDPRCAQSKEFNLHVPLKRRKLVSKMIDVRGWGNVRNIYKSPLPCAQPCACWSTSRINEKTGSRSAPPSSVFLRFQIGLSGRTCGSAVCKERTADTHPGLQIMGSNWAIRLLSNSGHWIFAIWITKILTHYFKSTQSRMPISKFRIQM